LPQQLVEIELSVHDNLLRRFSELPRGEPPKPSVHGSVTEVMHLHKHADDSELDDADSGRALRALPPSELKCRILVPYLTRKAFGETAEIRGGA